MLRRDPNYQRLPGRSRSLLRRSSYWLGPDHLLAVQIEMYTERYRRFAYRNIEAVVVRRTQRFAVLNVLGISTAVLFLAGSWGTDGATRVALAICTGLALGVTILNLALGPTCETWLRTAVQTETLPGWNRLRQTQVAVTQLAARVTAAQTS
jgi:hypothetical protein